MIEKYPRIVGGVITGDLVGNNTVQAPQRGGVVRGNGDVDPVFGQFF